MLRIFGFVIYNIQDLNKVSTEIPSKIKRLKGFWYCKKKFRFLRDVIHGRPLKMMTL